MHRDIFIHMKTYKETCTQTGKKKKKVKSHTHTSDTGMGCKIIGCLTLRSRAPLRSI